jgi:dGTP triphosphohydrolase
LARELNVLKEIMWCFVFGKLRESQAEQQKMIEVLFAHFINEGKRDRTVFERHIQDSLGEDEKVHDDFDANIARAAADQIATMTEDDVVYRYEKAARASS